MVEVGLGIQPKSAVHLSEEVLDFEIDGEGTIVITNKSKYRANKLIVCGGLQADRLAKSDGVKLKEEWLVLEAITMSSMIAKHKVRNLIYPYQTRLSFFRCALY